MRHITITTDGAYEVQECGGGCYTLRIMLFPDAEVKGQNQNAERHLESEVTEQNQ